jgi:hypothetical protein
MAGPFQLTSFEKHLGSPADVFICSASFEDRCRSIPDQINPNSVGSVLVCENQALLEYVGKNGKYLRDRFGDKTIPVSLDINDPLKIADNLEEGLDKVIKTSPQKFLIDTTTFTREALLIMLSLLRSKLMAVNTILFTYAAAKEYSVGQEGENKWLSKGISSIRSVLGYPGELLPSRKFHLVVLAGFELERAAKLIETYESAVVSVGFGREDQSIRPNHYEINKAFHQSLCDLYNNVETFSFSLVDPVQAKLDIEKQIAAKQDSNLNIVIAALNNKISTIGAALAAFKNPDFQLCYAQANYYNVESYSSPGDEFYLFELPGFLTAEANSQS